MSAIRDNPNIFWSVGLIPIGMREKQQRFVCLVQASSEKWSKQQQSKKNHFHCTECLWNRTKNRKVFNCIILFLYDRLHEWLHLMSVLHKNKSGFPVRFHEEESEKRGMKERTRDRLLDREDDRICARYMVKIQEAVSSHWHQQKRFFFSPNVY